MPTPPTRRPTMDDRQHARLRKRWVDWALEEGDEATLLDALERLAAGRDPVTGEALADAAMRDACAEALVDAAPVITLPVLDRLFELAPEAAYRAADHRGLTDEARRRLVAIGLEECRRNTRPDADRHHETTPDRPAREGYGGTDRGRIVAASEMLARLTREHGLPAHARSTLLTWVVNDFEGTASRKVADPRAFRAAIVNASVLRAVTDWAPGELWRLWRPGAGSTTLRRQVVEWADPRQRSIFRQLLATDEIDDDVLEALALAIDQDERRRWPPAGAWWRDRELQRLALRHGYPPLDARLVGHLPPERAAAEIALLAEDAPAWAVHALEGLDDAHRHALERDHLRPLLAAEEAAFRQAALRALGRTRGSGRAR